MKILKTVLAILFATSISQVCFAFSKVPSVADDTCPAEETIQHVGTTYNTPGGWTGQIQNKPGEVKTFDFVLYKPKDSQHPFKEGTLLRCSYKLDNGNSLDLRLPETASQAHITDHENWKSAYHGHQYDCSKSRTDCKFNLVK
jgi:hypothetical protein